ncbi:cation:proton antiporter [Chromatiaceae bacterium AAb-1]|nr:cation:proton antiporter [Chromatiaceae bacterium AAb-1]
MVSSLATFGADILLFVIIPFAIWQLLRKTIPLAVLPILVGLLLAATGWAEQFHPGASFISTQLGFIGVLLLAFSAGLEMHINPGDNTTEENKLGPARRLLFSALNALLLPFIVGSVAAYTYFNHLPGWESTGTSALYSALAIGLCIAVSALPVLIGIVRELPAEHQFLGRIALKLAVIDDVVLWCGLALLLIIAGSSTAAVWGSTELLAMLLLAALPFIGAILKKYPVQLPAAVVWVIAALFLAASSWATYKLGLHAILGAYFAGAIFPLPLLKRLPAAKLGSFALFLLAPLFFGYSGLQINADALNSTAMYAAFLLLLISLLTKIGAVMLYSPSSQLSRRETLAVGSLLQCKGLMEIVAATILYQQGLISEYAYAALVTLAVLSTTITGPLFRLCTRLKKSSSDTNGCLPPPANRR